MCVCVNLRREGVTVVAEVSLMRIGSRIMDVAFGVLAQMAGSSSTPKAVRVLGVDSSVFRWPEMS